MLTLAYGMPGTGKSTLCHDIVSAQCMEQRFLVCDHEAGWGPDSPLWRGSPPPNLTVVEGRDPLPTLSETGVWAFRNREPRDIAAYCVEQGDCVYVDDEIDKSGRRIAFDDSALRLIVNEGRHLPNKDGDICEVHILGACRRPQKLHTDLTDLVSQVFIFRVQGSRTLQRLQDDSMIEDEQWELLRNLPNFQCWHWKTGAQGQWMEIKPL